MNSKRAPQRSKSIPSKNITRPKYNTPPINTKAQPKLNKRVTAPACLKVKPNRAVSFEHERHEHELEACRHQKVIDLSKYEDVENMVAQLVALLGNSLHGSVNSDSDNITRSDWSDTQNVFTTHIPPERKKETYNKANPRQESAKVSFYTRLKNETKKQELASETRIKLPLIAPEQSSLFQVRYSQPTNFRSLQSKLQRVQTRPRSLSSFTDRGMNFSRMRAQQTRESQNSDTSRWRSMTFPGVSSRYGRDSELKTISRKSKYGRYSVTFVDRSCNE